MMDQASEQTILHKRTMKQKCQHYYQIRIYSVLMWASLMAQQVTNPPAMQETQKTGVQSLGGEDSLEQDVATHSSILDWEILWTEEPGGLQSMGSQRVGHD